MDKPTTNHDDGDTRAYLGHTVHDNGDATVDWIDESGEISTETIVGYLPPLKRVTLVDLDGHPVPDCERDIPEIDGAGSWPVCCEYDAVTYEVSDPAERAALEAAAIAEECDRRDAPPARDWEEGGPDDPFARAEAEDAWHAAGCPGPDEWPTAEEVAGFDAEEEHRAVREWFDRRESFSSWLEANGGPAVG